MKIKSEIIYRTGEDLKFHSSYDKKNPEIGEIKLISTSFCCGEMEKAWEERVVNFGEYDNILNRDNNVNIYKCEPYPEGAVWDEYPIKFCPFCGEQIIIKFKKRLKEK